MVAMTNKEANLLRMSRGRINKQAYVDQRTGSTCECCGEKWPIELLEFHHKNPKDKLFELQQQWNTKVVKQKVLDEADKCALLCSNCHALEHVALRKGESILNDKDTYIRYRDHRHSHYQQVKSPHDRLLGQRNSKDKQLLLPL